MQGRFWLEDSKKDLMNQETSSKSLEMSELKLGFFGRQLQSL